MTQTESTWKRQYFIKMKEMRAFGETAAVHYVCNKERKLGELYSKSIFISW